MLGVALVGVFALDRAGRRRPVLVRDDRCSPALALVLAAIALRRPLARWRPAAPTEARGTGVGLVAVAFGALIVVYLEALFRAGRLAGLSAWDAWAFWVPKAKAIYFFGGLDEQFFRELANPTYPPLVPALEASAFHFMGSADVVTLHLQFWFFACGFVAAVAGLLAPRVPALLLWPFLLLVLVAPRVVGPESRSAGRLHPRLLLRARGTARRALARRPRALAPRAAATVFMGAALLDQTRRAAARRVRPTRGARRFGVALETRVAAAASCRSGRRRSGDPVANLVHAPATSRASFRRRACFAFFDHRDRGWPAFESVITHRLRLRPLARSSSPRRRCRDRARVPGRGSRASCVHADALRPRDRRSSPGCCGRSLSSSSRSCRTRE